MAEIRALFDEHFDFVWRTLRRVGLTAGMADDAAQEVFVIAAGKLALIEPARERSFLLGTALRVAANARRVAGRKMEVSGDDALDAIDRAPGPDELLDRHQRRVLLDRALEALEDELRVVLVLAELEGLTAPEIAAHLELPVGTVASRLRRARERFSAVAKRLQTARTFTEAAP